MALMKSRTLSISVNCDTRKVYEFVSKPENLPKWAKAFCKSIKKLNGEWIVETPDGQVKFRFVKKNDFGVLDQYVTISGVEIFVPMRAIPNGDGSEVLFTLFRPADMPDKNYSKDIKFVEKDLKNLKSIMEGMK